MERFWQVFVQRDGRHVYCVPQTHRLLVGTDRGTLSIQGYCPYHCGFTLIDSGCLEPEPELYQENEPEPEPEPINYVEEID